jgi:hypothetical protein
MPNWVSNEVNIYGTEEEITKVREFVNGTRTQEPFSFESIFPTEYVNRPDDWGTKWDAHEVNFEDGVDALKYSFDTAWDAPRGVFAKLVEEFPATHISWFYRDETDTFEGYLLHYQGKQMGDVKFLDLDNDNELEIFDLIVNDEVDIQRCQFEGEETKCPMFELADDPRNDRDCSKQKWEGFKSFCELLPEKTTYREDEYEDEETN